MRCNGASMTIPRTARRRAGALARPLLPVLGIAAVLIGYVAIAGSTGFCPTCALIVDTVTGRERAVRTVTNESAPKAGGRSAVHDLVLTDLEGNPVPLSNYAGRPILIDVWATWCAPCRKSRKVLASIADELKAHATVLSVSVDRDGAGVVRNYIGEESGGAGSPFVELMGNTDAFRDMLKPYDRQPTIPKLVFVDASGRVIDIEYGVARPRWVLKRLQAMAGSGRKG